MAARRTAAARKASAIVRVWRGWAAASNPLAYPRHFRRSVLPELKGIDGFLGARLLKLKQGREIEFVVHTKWQSMAAIRAFAGMNVNRAVVESGAIAALTRYERKVRHYKIIAEA